MRKPEFRRELEELEELLEPNAVFHAEVGGAGIEPTLADGFAAAYVRFNAQAGTGNQVHARVRPSRRLILDQEGQLDPGRFAHVAFLITAGHCVVDRPRIDRHAGIRPEIEVIVQEGIERKAYAETRIVRRGNAQRRVCRVQESRAVRDVVARKRQRVIKTKVNELVIVVFLMLPRVLVGRLGRSYLSEQQQNDNYGRVAADGF